MESVVTYNLFLKLSYVNTFEFAVLHGTYKIKECTHKGLVKI